MKTENAEALYNDIATALTKLLTKRIEHFTNTDKLYRRRRNSSIPLGFEALIEAELYCLLQQKYKDDVFLQFPSKLKDRIDLAIWPKDESRALIELKMYYSDNRNAYGKDFQKLRDIIDPDNSVLAVIIHFHFYPNKNNPASSLFKKFYDSLPERQYWRSLQTIGDENGQHFRVLAFCRIK